MQLAGNMPGVTTAQSVTFTSVLKSVIGKMVQAIKPIIMDGSKSRDIRNTPTTIIGPGLIIGKITSGGKYAPSIIGTVGSSYAGTATSLTLSVASAVELVRRVGSSGTFKLTGPPTASGTVRTVTVTYSAVDTATGVVTISAIGVNEVQTVTVSGSVSAGTFVIRVGDIATGPIAYNANQSAIQSALDSAFGTNGVVVAGTLASFTLTFSGTGYAQTDVPMAVIDCAGLTAGTKILVEQTTQGVDGRFVSGSLVQPTDGSETPLLIVGTGDGSGFKVVDPDGNNIDVFVPEALIGGQLDVACIGQYPTDTSLIAWLKNQLAAKGQQFFWSDDL